MFTGVYTAIITPFLSDGSLDEVAFVKILNQQIAGGVDGVVVLGTTGESPTLSDEESKKLLQIAVSTADKKIKIIAGTGANCTATAIKKSLMAQNCGVDGLLQVNPYYNKPTQEGMFQHFSAVADAVDIPIMLYNILGRCGVNLETPTLLQLAQHSNIVCVKEASGDLVQMREVIAAAPIGFTVLSGDDGLTVDLMKMGGDGVVSVLSNALPAEMKSLVTACQDQDWEKAEKMNQDLDGLFADCFIETNPQPIKTLMSEEGFCEEFFRLPMIAMQSDTKEKLLKTWSEYQSL